MNGHSTTASVTAIRSVEFGVLDLDASRRFYEDVWQLTPTERYDGAAYFRASGPDHHVLALRQHDSPALLRASLAAPNRAAVDALYEQVGRDGGTPLGAPAALDEPGGGYGFTFTDPEGRTFAISSEVETQREATPTADRPRKISHIVVNAVDADRSMAFLRDALGFRKRDETARMVFMGCSPDHHSIAITRMGTTSLNHVAFEVPDLNSLMRGAARVRRAGHALEWGIGRHGPGSNIFAYFCDPSEIVIEYTDALDQIDDATYTPHGPDYWKPPIPGNPDYWGFAAPPSERFERATGALHPAAPVAP